MLNRNYYHLRKWYLMTDTELPQYNRQMEEGAVRLTPLCPSCSCPKQHQHSYTSVSCCSILRQYFQSLVDVVISYQSLPLGFSIGIYRYLLCAFVQIHKAFYGIFYVCSWEKKVIDVSLLYVEKKQTMRENINSKWL